MRARKLNEPFGYLVSSLANLGSRWQVKRKKKEKAKSKRKKELIYM